MIRPDRIRLTRKDLVLAAANKDGGAHVDSILDPGYEMVLSGAGWLMTTREGGLVKNFAFKHGHVSALRQMGYEILNSPDVLALRP